MNRKKNQVLAPFVIATVILTYLEISLLHVYRNVSEDEIYILYIYHFLLLAFIYSYYKTSFTNPGILTQQIAESQPIAQIRRVCRFCEKNKPIRCHHCKKCNQCILRMGNHCWWVNNCIGKNNYKFFFCLLFYLTITLITYFVIFVKKIYVNPPIGTVDTILIYCSAPLCFIILASQLFFLGFHIRLIIHNQTPIEYFEKKKEKYDSGLWANCEEFLGSSWWMWLIPI